MARARRARPSSLEDRLVTDDPAVWTSAAERARVAALLAAGGVDARAELLDLGACCPPVYDVAVDVLDGTPKPLARLRGRALDDAVAAAVESVVNARRVAALREWVAAAGLAAPAARRQAEAAVSTRFGPDLVGSW